MARTEPLPKSRHLVYLARAKEFSGQMERASSEKAWNSVGLLGVHSVISACDALTILFAGRRWSGQTHGGVLGMVRDLNIPNADAALRQVADVLEMKNQVEYEARVFTEGEALALKRRSERILNWVIHQITEA